MQIFVKSATGSTHVFSVHPEDFVENLREQMEMKDGVPSTMQEMFFSGKVLKDRTMLLDYNIQNNSTIHSCVMLAGGIIEPSMKALAQKYNCEKNVCRKCYARLPPKATNCRKRKCGHSSNIRPKKKLK